jgi:hypothetical protein
VPVIPGVGSTPGGGDCKIGESGIVGTLNANSPRLRDGDRQPLNHDRDISSGFGDYYLNEDKMGVDKAGLIRRSVTLV